MALLGLFAVGFLSFIFRYRSSLPETGLYPDTDLVVRHVLPGGPAETAGVRIGDVIKEVDGLPVVGYIRWNALSHRPAPGGPLALAVERNGSVMDIMIPTARKPSSEYLPIMSLVAFGLLATAFLVYYQRSGDRGAQLLFVSNVLFAAALPIVMDMESYITSLPIMMVWFPMANFAGAAGLRLSLAFPRTKPLFRRRWSTALIYGTSTAWSLYWIVSEPVLLTRFPPGLQRLQIAMGGLNALTVGIFFGLALVSYVHSFLYIRTYTARRQLQWVFLGYALSLPLVIFMLFYYPLMEVTALFMPARPLLGIFGLAIPLGIGFAMLKYRLVEVDIVLKDATIYLASMVISVGIYCAAYVVLEMWFGALGLKVNLLPIIIATFLMAALFPSVMSGANTVIRWWIFHRRFDLEKVLLHGTQKILSGSTRDEILAGIGEMIKVAFSLTSVGVYLYDEEMGSLRMSAGDAVAHRATIALHPGDPVYRHLVMGWRPIISGEDEAAYALKSLGASALLPLHTREKLLGCVSLGEKRDRGPYSAEDVILAGKFLHDGSLALENLRLYEEEAKRQGRGDHRRGEEAVRRILSPERFPPIKGLDVASIRLAGQSPGGSYCDVMFLKDERYACILGSASDGLQGALRMSLLKGFFRSLAASGEIVPAPMNYANGIIMGQVPGLRALLVHAVMEMHAGIVRISCAGHPSPFFFRHGHGEILEFSDPPLGEDADRTFDEKIIPVGADDLFVFLSPWWFDAFGTARLEESILTHVRLSSADIAARLSAEADDLCRSSPLQEDAQLLVVKCA